MPPPASQDDILPARLDGTSYETFYGGYRTNDAYPQFLGDLEAAYPDLVQVIDHSSSFTGANPLQVACVTADASVPVPRSRSRRRCRGRPASARLRPGSGCARQLGPLHGSVSAGPGLRR